MSTMSGLTAQANRLSHLTHDLSQCCQAKEEQIFARFGLSLAEGRVLQAVAGGGAVSSTGVARTLNIVRSRLTPLVDGLAEKRFLKRMESEDDRRVRTLTLTVSGRKVARDVTDFQISFHESLLQKFEPAQREQLFEVLTQLHEAMEELRRGLRDEARQET
jgi:DNA-binding MarR family transcriptional regulator